MVTFVCFPLLRLDVNSSSNSSSCVSQEQRLLKAMLGAAEDVILSKVVHYLTGYDVLQYFAWYAHQ